MSARVETVIVGGGQAGLETGKVPPNTFGGLPVYQERASRRGVTQWKRI